MVNGLVMVAGFIAAVLLTHERTLSRFPRVLAGVVAVLCIPGIYLTKTRAVWLVLAVGLVVCVVFPEAVILVREAREGFGT